jgi:alpha-beta hydrolase superfamily lysophospholipase
VTTVPVPDREETLAIEDGALHLEHYSPRGPAAGLLVAVHGFDAHCARYRHVGAAFAAQGYATTLFDCRGHGRSTGRRGHVTSFDHYGADLAAVVTAARSAHPEGPLVVMGHSQGGTVALDAVLREVIKPDRLVLAAPWLGLAMAVPWWKRLPAPLLSRLWPTLTMGNGLRASDVSRNPAAVESRDADPLIHHVASARWFQEVQACQARIRNHVGPLLMPTLVLVAGQDKIVSTEATLTFAAGAGPAVAVRRYPDLYHELFLEPEQDQVLADIIGWLRAPVAASADLGRASLVVPGIL